MVRLVTKGFTAITLPRTSLLCRERRAESAAAASIWRKAVPERIESSGWAWKERERERERRSSISSFEGYAVPACADGNAVYPLC